MNDLRFSVLMVTLTACAITAVAFRAIANNTRTDPPYIQRHQSQLAPDTLQARWVPNPDRGDADSTVSGGRR